MTSGWAVNEVGWPGARNGPAMQRLIFPLPRSRNAKVEEVQWFVPTGFDVVASWQLVKRKLPTVENGDNWPMSRRQGDQRIINYQLASSSNNHHWQRIGYSCPFGTMNSVLFIFCWRVLLRAVGRTHRLQVFEVVLVILAISLGSFKLMCWYNKR